MNFLDLVDIVFKLVGMNKKRVMKNIRSTMTRVIRKFTSACGHEDSIREACESRWMLEDDIEHAIDSAYKSGVMQGKYLRENSK